MGLLNFLDPNSWLLTAIEETFSMCLHKSNKMRYLRLCFKLLGLSLDFFISNQTTHIHSSLLVTLKEKCFMCIDASRKFVRSPKFRLQITSVDALLTQDFIDTYCYLRMRNVAFLWLLLSKPSFSRKLSSVINAAEINIIKRYFVFIIDPWYLELLKFGLYYYLKKLFECPQDLILRWPFYLFCNRTTRETC